MGTAFSDHLTPELQTSNNKLRGKTRRLATLKSSGYRLAKVRQTLTDNLLTHDILYWAIEDRRGREDREKGGSILPCTSLDINYVEISTDTDRNVGTKWLPIRTTGLPYLVNIQ